MTLRTLTLLAALSAPLLARAEIIGLLPVTGSNVDPGTCEAARDAMRGHLEKTGREVRLAAGDPALEPTGPQAIAAAQAVGAGRAAVVRLSILGTTLRGRLAVFDVASGKQVHVDELSGDSLADVDVVLQRLAQAYAKQGSAAATAQVDTVTQKEAAPLAKLEATRSFGIRLGGIRLLEPSTSSLDAGGGVYWQYDARSYLVDVVGDGFWGAHYWQGSFGLDVAIPLGKGNLSPYLGGGLRYAWNKINDDWSAGLQTQVMAGVIFGRITTVQLRGEVAWFYNAFQNAGTNVNGLTVTLGAAF